MCIALGAMFCFCVVFSIQVWLLEHRTLQLWHVFKFCIVKPLILLLSPQICISLWLQLQVSEPLPSPHPPPPHTHTRRFCSLVLRCTAAFCCYVLFKWWASFVIYVNQSCCVLPESHFFSLVHCSCHSHLSIVVIMLVLLDALWLSILILNFFAWCRHKCADEFIL